MNRSRRSLRIWLGTKCGVEGARGEGKEGGVRGRVKWEMISDGVQRRNREKAALTLISSAMSVCRLFFSSRSLPTCEPKAGEGEARSGQLDRVKRSKDI
jgi:hypothetical protein